MTEREKLIQVENLQSCHETEEILRFLRSEKTTKIDSIRLLHVGTGMPLGEAKKAVFASETWSDRFQSDEEFLDAQLSGLVNGSRSETAA